MYFDWTFLILIPAIILTMFTQGKVSRAYNRYANEPNLNGISGEEAARRIMAAKGFSIPINPVRGNLTDNYNPKDKSLNLSEGIYAERTIAAVSVAAHEVGHAQQDREAYALLRLRGLMVPVVNMISWLSWPLLLIGVLLVSVDSVLPGNLLIHLGIAFFSLVVLFHLVTLPVELNASKRAMNDLTDLGILRAEEVNGARKMLSAAALTYVAALATALVNILRMIIIARH